MNAREIHDGDQARAREAELLSLVAQVLTLAGPAEDWGSCEQALAALLGLNDEKETP